MNDSSNILDKRGVDLVKVEDKAGKGFPKLVTPDLAFLFGLTFAGKAFVAFLLRQSRDLVDPLCGRL